MKIIRTYNKKQGYWYVHEDTAYWDKAKKQTRHNRKTIGKSSTKDGPIIYNDTYKLEHPEYNKDTEEPPKVSSTKSLGEVILLETIIKELKLRDTMYKSIGVDKTEQVLDIAKYIICTEKAISWAGDWAQDKRLSISRATSQSITKMIQSITNDDINTFSNLWIGKNQCKKGYFCFDSTNIATYSKTSTPDSDYGYAHGHVSLPQVNLAILSRQDNGTPVQSFIYNGSIHDSSTLVSLIENLDKLNLKQIIITLDRGYYSENNIKTLIKSRNGFIMPIPKRVKWQYDVIDSVKIDLNSVKANVEIEDENGDLKTIYCVRKLVKRYGHRLYTYVVYNPHKKAEDEIRFRELIQSCYNELKSNKLVESHKAAYEQFFEVKETPKKGRVVKEKISSIEEFNNSYAGYWCLLSSEKRECAEIYMAYRNRNTAEQFYDIMKNDLKGNMVRSHSRKTFNAQMFIRFIALIILSKLKKSFAENRQGNPTLNRLKSYRQLLFKMTSLTEVKFESKRKPMYSKPTKVQQEVIKRFNLNWPYKS